MLNRKGQTLIEVMVAIGIFVLVMVSIISLISVGKNVGNLSIQKMMAENYVQEGMEKVRNRRDYNLKNNQFFRAGIDDGSRRVESVGETFQVTSVGPEALSQGFTRDINIQPDGSNSILVTVSVTWGSGKKVEAKEYLTNWSP